MRDFAQGKLTLGVFQCVMCTYTADCYPDTPASDMLIAGLILVPAVHALTWVVLEKSMWPEMTRNMTNYLATTMGICSFRHAGILKQ